MRLSKGFTLIELVVVMIISSVLLCIAIPSFIGTIERSHAQDAQTNLLAIYAAQLNYYNNNNAYYYGSDVNGGLTLSIIGNGVTYDCTNANTFTCKATRTSTNGFVLSLRGDTAISLTDHYSGGNPWCSLNCTNL